MAPELANRLRFATFNCTGIKSSKEFICNSLLNSVEILALQETWLMPHDIGLPNTLSDNFSAFSVSSVKVDEGLLRGRPYCGLSFRWSKQLGQKFRVVTYDDDRLLGLYCSSMVTCPPQNLLGT